MIGRNERRRRQTTPGHVDVLVLTVLPAVPGHGYAVTRWIRDMTGGALEIEEGTLHTALDRMRQHQGQQDLEPPGL